MPNVLFIIEAIYQGFSVCSQYCILAKLFINGYKTI